MKTLIEKLNKAAEAYYNGKEIISDKEYDALYDQLLEMERKTGIILPGSPTQRVGTKAVDYLSKVKHEYPALSLDKTKDIDLFQTKFTEGINTAWRKGFDGSKEVCLMWKLDGGTVVATYEDGVINCLATRGNGEEGSDITHNAPFIEGLPLKIPYKGKIVVRGEVMMSYREFNHVNSLLSEEEQYKNPRNLANATMQMLDNSALKSRRLAFMAHNFVYADSGRPDLASTRFETLKSLGFDVVPYAVMKPDELSRTMQVWEKSVNEFAYPVDGLVACMEDLMYAESLPGTGHNPNVMSGYAFKWTDETSETVIRSIEWSPSRTGLLNPVAVFDPVELCGTTVSRASLHNLAYMVDKDIKIGDTVTVYKANMIIPQIDENLSAKKRAKSVKMVNDYITIKECPACKGTLSIHNGEDGMTWTLHCGNPLCAAKRTGEITHMAERDCLDIKGLSEERVEFLTSKGYIKNRYDLFTQAGCYSQGYGILNSDGNDLEDEEGWGKQSVKNLVDAINAARHTDFVSFIHAMGIPNVGKGQAKLLKKHLEENYEKLKEMYMPADHDDSYDLMGLLTSLVAADYDFTAIEGFGTVITDSLNRWVERWLIDPVRLSLDEDMPDWEISALLSELRFTDKPSAVEKKSVIEGKVFVITGSLNHYSNREELVSVLEKLGAKVSGSVSKNTDYLLNNDSASMSGKNRKAKELKVPVITEEELSKMLDM